MLLSYDTRPREAYGHTLHLLVSGPLIAYCPACPFAAQVDFETLGRLLGREAEGLLLQARSQIESIDLPSLSLDRRDVEGALAEAVATAETALQRLDGPLLWGDRNLQEALGSLPPTLASHESVQGLLTFLKLVRTPSGDRDREGGSEQT